MTGNVCLDIAKMDTAVGLLYDYSMLQHNIIAVAVSNSNWIKISKFQFRQDISRICILGANQTR